MHILAMLLSLLFAPIAAPPPEYCDAVHASIGGELETWLGYDNNGWGWPADTRPVHHTNFAEGGIIEYRAKSLEGTYWLIWFQTYDAKTDAQGNYAGSHEFCGPYRFSD